MDNLDAAGMHHHHPHPHVHPTGGGVVGPGGHATPNVTVTVGGPSVMLPGVQFNSSSGGVFSASSRASSEINLNASAIVASTTDCHVMSFEETKQLLAKHLQETTRRCCAAAVAAASGTTCGTSTASGMPYSEEEANFDGIDLGVDDQTPMPLGDILEKLQEETSGLTSGNPAPPAVSEKTDDLQDFIRLHSVNDQPQQPTISATVNVATLDLSDPDSIHQHLSQLNDTVLRVPTGDHHRLTSNTPSQNDDFFNDSNHDDGNQSSQPPANNPSSTISISLSHPSTSTSASVQTEDLKRSDKTASALTISKKSAPTPSTTATNSTSSSPLSVRKAGSSSGSKASPQSCSVCSKVFSNASALAKHRLTHSEERRYHCNICGKAFKRQDHLNGHLLTHRSTKPFACHAEGCGKSYCDARSLRRHKENHHGQTKLEKSDQVPGDKSAESTILSGPDHLISKNLGSGDTKIKFSSKGLTAQQLQLIEQLFKQSKKGSPAGTTDGKGAKASLQAPPPLNATIKKSGGNGGSGEGKATQQLPDKPVECTICSRKFKNIPALNGHMRLHGGYYKKDAEGRRLVAAGMSAAANNPLKTVGLAQSSNVPISSTATAPAAMASNKRKASVGGDQTDLQQQPPQKKCLTPTLSMTYCQSQPSLPVPPQPPQQPLVSTLPSFAFSSLPQPDTSKLLANLELKAKEMMTSEVSSVTSAVSTTTTSSLRAMRKPPSASKKAAAAAVSALPVTNPTASLTSGLLPDAPTSNSPIASLINTQPLPALPLVPLPTKPLPVQMTVSSSSHEMTSGEGMSKSIQITALIQSNPISHTPPMSSAVNTNHSTDFSRTPEQGLLVSNLPFNGHPTPLQIKVGTPLYPPPPLPPAPQHHHHHHHHHHVKYSVSSGAHLKVLKVDESADKAPKVGSDYQALIPDFEVDTKGVDELLPSAQPLWHPRTAEGLSEMELTQYLLLASSCAVAGGSHNEEVALEILQRHQGHIQSALQELLNPEDGQSAFSSEEDSLSLMSSQDSEDEMEEWQQPASPPWQPFEVDMFYEALVRYHKDFHKVSRHIATKSVKECVEFYYLWKNICFEESQSFKSLFAQTSAASTRVMNGSTDPMGDKSSIADMASDEMIGSVSSASASSVTAVVPTVV